MIKTFHVTVLDALFVFGFNNLKKKQFIFSILLSAVFIYVFI